MHKYTFSTAARTSMFAAAFTLFSVSVHSRTARAAQSVSPVCINNRFADGHMVLHFDAPQQADHIVLATLNAPTGTVVRISDGAHSVGVTTDSASVNLSDVMLRAPLAGTDFTVSIDSVSMSDDAVCITDVRLSQGSVALVPHVEAVANTQDPDAAMLIGTWNSSVSNTASGSLHIAADGSWQLQTNQGVRQGSWQYSDGQLQMRLGTDGSYTCMHMLTQVVAASPNEELTGAETSHTVMMLSGALIAELQGTYTSVQAH